MVSDLGKIEPNRLTGTERFNVDGLGEVGTVGAFWQWSASDLLGNTNRGVLAEYLVALALGVDVSGTRNEWAASDLRTPDGVTVQVKSAAYLQSWHQDHLSNIVFDVKPRRAWDPDSNKLEDKPKRHSQVYVFALFQHKDKATVNPLDVTQWRFFVLPRSVLDARTRSQHSITDKSLRDLAGDGVPLAQVKEAVRRAADLPSPPVTAIPPTRRRMNRTTLYKIQYVAAFLAVLGTAIALTLWLDAGIIGAVAVAAVLMVPGRVLGVLWRDLFRGRALLDRGHPEEAIGHLRSFLDTLERQPWRRRLWWLSWAIYSRDPVAMALNNIGAAQLRLDRLAEAEVSLRWALREDPLYPVPYVNLGYAALSRSEEDVSAQHFATAARLGYARSATDRLAVAGSALLAQVEGGIGTTKGREDS